MHKKYLYIFGGELTSPNQVPPPATISTLAAPAPDRVVQQSSNVTTVPASLQGFLR